MRPRSSVWIRRAPGVTFLIARIESFARADIEHTSEQAVTQYRGQLMPLMALDGDPIAAEHVPVLVFADRGRSVGLMVEEIVDVVEDQLLIELSSSRPGLLGTAVIAGRVTEIIDAGHWLKQGWQDWFSDNPGPRNAAQRRPTGSGSAAGGRRHCPPPPAAAAVRHCAGRGCR